MRGSKVVVYITLGVGYDNLRQYHISSCYGKEGSMMQGMSEEKLAILKQEYVRLCCAPRIGAIKLTISNIKDLEVRLGQYQKAIVETIRAIEFKKLELETLKIIPDMGNKEKEFEGLLIHPDIENISVDGSTIIISTVNIEIEYRRVVYDIGKFNIYISSDINAGWVLLYKNLTRHAGGGYNHPHINSEGRPCLGNIQECLPQMIGAHQYAAAISVAIQYLKSYTNDSDGKPYTDIQNWPVRKKAKVVMGARSPITIQEEG